ncbi:hypothetical protein CKF94_12040 [Vibrio coralliilyticus]|uniref:hypothetical protein n=1 Tax=Vibrio coralliilyticus TaxID=190893 RepID=UPI000BAAE24A|nr:hypothetical protein [Vibrio coralliilyticus]PAU37749.1 hypothetical protein CKF94_12040 [Vibrio coralliilyticus]
MKFSHTVFLFVAGLFGVLFGGLFLGLILDRFHSGDLETGDMATWAAAFGTICTLGFLINQHTQLREVQKQEKEERKAEEAKQRAEIKFERDKREEHERRQQDLWQIQKESIALQKYDAHKKMFFSLLSGIEHRFKPSVEFYDKDALYHNFFPENGIESCHTKIALESESQASPRSLKDCLDAYASVEKTLNMIHGSTSKDYYKNAHSLFGSLLQLQSILCILVGGNERFGYVSPNFDKDWGLINVFETQESIFCIQESLKRICQFVSVEPAKDIAHKADGAFMKDTLLYFTLACPNLRGFEFNFGEHEQALRAMHKCYTIFKNPDLRKNQEINSLYIRLCNLFGDKAALTETLESKQDTRRLLRDLLLEIAELDDSKQCKSEVTELRDRLRGLIRLYRVVER